MIWTFRNLLKFSDSLICKRAVWDTDDEGYWQENYKAIDDWELWELWAKLGIGFCVELCYNIANREGV